MPEVKDKKPKGAIKLGVNGQTPPSDLSLQLIAAKMAACVDEISERFTELEGSKGTDYDAIGVEIKGLRETVEKLQKEKESINRASLPGVKLSQHGEPDSFSFHRALKLAYFGGKLRSSDPDAKNCGYELEVFKNMDNDLEKMPEVVQRTAINAGNGSAGALLVPTAIMEEILPQLVAQSIAAKLGVTVLPNLSGNVMWVREQGGVTAYYVDNDAEETGTESVPAFGTAEISPKWLAAFVPITMSMLIQPAVAMEQWARNEIIRRINLRRDKSAFLGDPTKKEPRGIFNSTTPGVQTYDFASPLAVYTGASQTLSDALQNMVGLIEDANAYVGATSLGWAAHPKVFRKIGRCKDGQGIPIFLPPSQALLEAVMGYKVGRSTQLTSGTITAENLLFGDYSQCVEGLWGTLALAASDQTETNFRKMRTTVRGVMAHDFACLQPTAFVEALNFNINGT